MKITIAILDCARWIAGILLAMEIPFAWILSDGLGPDAHETSGLEAVIRMLFFPGIRVLAIAFIALSVAVRLLSSRCAGEESGVKGLGKRLCMLLRLPYCCACLEWACSSIVSAGKSSARRKCTMSAYKWMNSESI